MCTKTILDASLFSRVEADEMEAWKRWIRNGYGILHYAASGTAGDELKKHRKALGFVRQQRRGQAQLVSREKLDQAASALRDTRFESNDRHMLELAFASEAEVLCTNDNKLKSDFLSKLPGPPKPRAVYPHEARRKDRDAFLDVRRCRR